jgi:hypothetical protein
MSVDPGTTAFLPVHRVLKGILDWPRGGAAVGQPTGAIWHQGSRIVVSPLVGLLFAG